MEPETSDSSFFVFYRCLVVFGKHIEPLSSFHTTAVYFPVCHFTELHRVINIGLSVLLLHNAEVSAKIYYRLAYLTGVVYTSFMHQQKQRTAGADYVTCQERTTVIIVRGLRLVDFCCIWCNMLIDAGRKVHPHRGGHFCLHIQFLIPSVKL